MNRLAPRLPALLALLFAGLLAPQIRAQPAAATELKSAHLEMALVNLKSLYSDSPDAEQNRTHIDANLKRHAYFIDKLATEGVEFIGFPELSVNGYHFSKNTTWLKLDGPEVAALKKMAREKGVYISVGLALEDSQGNRWNMQIVIDPMGRIIGVHRKILMAAEKGYVKLGSFHNVFDVKGLKMGILICADGFDYRNLKKLADNGARLIHYPNASDAGGSPKGFYDSRAKWPGWVADLKLYAAAHNVAALYNPDFDPPPGKDIHQGWSGGAWFIGPDGRTLAQQPPSKDRADCKECVLRYAVPIPSLRK
ncbi:MAG: nitrilase-related carbon-nitrogen hydrolase [Gemmataceae bacterium]